MFVFYLAIAVLSLPGLRIRPRNEMWDSVGMDQCNAIKGISILVVFLRHVWDYVVGSGYASTTILDRLGLLANGATGQLLVVMFLFYSGFGIMESIRHGGIQYVESLPRRRIASTFLNFDVAVLLFTVLALATGKTPLPKRIFLSLLGWSDMGNSNWYIFDILCCYLAAFFSFSAFPPGTGMKRGLTMMTALIALLSWILLWSGKSGYWYDTILCFPAGACLSVFKSRFERLALQNWKLFFSGLTVSFVVAYATSRTLSSHFGCAAHILFAFFVVATTMKIRIGNQLLEWFGKNLFPLYIYQRIPMILLQKIDGGTFAGNHPFAYVMACFAITVEIARLYRFWQIKLR